MNDSALIGHSGFVGTTLLKQVSVEHLFRSTNIGDISGRNFDTVLCAGAPAQKWIANREPQADLAGIDTLISHLETVQCRRFILFSTVDVFHDPDGVDELTPVTTDQLQPYGRHRYRLEEFVRRHFENHLIVRLPGLVGPGLKKNVLFDFLNSNNLEQIESRSVFQFYPMVNLWDDVQTAIDLGLSLVHLTAAPLNVSHIARRCFGLDFRNQRTSEPVRYDFRSIHASAFGGSALYQYDERAALTMIRAYAQSESRTQVIP